MHKFNMKWKIIPCVWALVTHAFCRIKVRHECNTKDTVQLRGE